MKKANTSSSEVGDCSSQVTRYEWDTNNLIIDSVNCYDYGQNYYHYLLDKSEEIQMVHVKSITPMYDDESGAYLYEVSEHIVDFSDANSPNMKAVTEKMSQDTPETKVKFDENFDDSNPWIIINEKGDDFLFGKKINYEGDWQTAIKNALKNRLMDIDILPSRLLMTMNGTVGRDIEAQ
ncbi:hypothetical protein OAF63_02640 [Saprospiraceae bacterium]|jgi:hypothetical protein|nr:hypothetical protein [Saprospiraceae bacterium]